jgi:hypothetical protein
MRTKWLKLAALLAVATLAFSACGGGEKKGEGTLNCGGTAISSSDLKIPSDFPAPPSVTFTSSRLDGPSGVAEGYSVEELKQTYDEWHEFFERAGYSVLFDEIEENDAEISYKSKDGTRTGQVALRADCEQADRLFVHITDRPA